MTEKAIMPQPKAKVATGLHPRVAVRLRECRARRLLRRALAAPLLADLVDLRPADRADLPLLAPAAPAAPADPADPADPRRLALAGLLPVDRAALAVLAPVDLADPVDRPLACLATPRWLPAALVALVPDLVAPLLLARR